MTGEIGPRRGRRRGDCWTKVSHGLYRPEHELSGPPQDLEAWHLVLPTTGAFTHLTAAREHGWSLPPLPVDLPVFASMSKHESRPRRRGLIISRHDVPVGTLMINGLPLATPAETLLACARDLELLYLRSCTPDDLRRVGAQHRQGAPMLRKALRLSDGRGDLHIKGTRTLHEYDGAEHRKRRRHRDDLGRERRLATAKWTRHGYTNREVLTQAVAILREADAALGRPHRPERVRAWHHLLLDSLFTPSGTHRLRVRCGLAQRDPRSGQDRH